MFATDPSTQPDSLIRVLVVDDSVAVRSALEVFFLAMDDLELVGAAGNGQEAVQLCARMQPDVVLMDIKMPIMDGITATRLIRQANPRVQVVALSSFADPDLVREAMDAGAFCYLLKNAPGEEIAGSIRAAREQDISPLMPAR